MQLYKKVIILLTVLLCGTSYEQIVSAPLNILFVVGRFPSPSQTFILNIITGLIDKGHNVFIFSFHQGELRYAHPNIKKYKLLDHVVYKKFPTRSSHYDIVFCQFGGLGKKILENRTLSQWLSKRKVVVCFRGSDITTADPNAYKKVFKKGDLFLPVCDYFRKKLIALGCSVDKIVVHYSAIDCSKFFFAIRQKPENDSIHLISVCRLVKKKGLDYAIKAFAEVSKKHTQLHYDVVGEGPERIYLELLIRQLGLQDKITLHGWKSQNDIVSMLNSAHIFLLPSRKASDGNEEGIANALKESMAMGLISVATWHAGTPELIEDGVSGFLVPEKNVYKLANTIDYIIEHPEIWESVGLAGRKKVKDEFETKQSIVKLEKIFYTLLGTLKETHNNDMVNDEKVISHGEDVLDGEEDIEDDEKDVEDDEEDYGEDIEDDEEDGEDHGEDGEDVEDYGEDVDYVA